MTDTVDNSSKRHDAARRLGTVLEGRYRLVGVLGEGGMGAVYEAEHTVIARRVAIKMLHPRYGDSGSATERFLREARAASAIDHPNVIEILDVGRADDGTVFIVMELLRGSSLAALIAAGDTRDADAATRIALGVLDGLAAAHARGIVHRDLKPDNVLLLDGRCAADAVRIVDFGISKVTDRALEADTLTHTGAVLGTPYYMSPEQASGERDIDARTDVWAVGVMLYEMLTGELPFPGDSYNAVLAAVLTKTPRPCDSLNPDIAPELRAVVEHALTREREARPASAAELADAIRAVRDTLGLPPVPGTAIGLAGALGATLDSASAISIPTPRATPSDARRPSAETLLGETLDAASAPLTPTTRTLDESHAEGDTRPPERKRTSRPTLDVVGAAPRWKVALWYLTTLPLAWLPGWIALRGGEERLRGLLALPESMPAWVTLVVILCWCGGLTVAAYRVAGFWQHGRWNRWLHGEGFVVFPLIGLAMTLFHFQRLSTQHESHIQSLRAYTAINEDQARQIVGMLETSNDRFLSAASMDNLLIGLIALIVLLGYLFVRPADGAHPGGRKRWLVIPFGVVVFATLELAGVYPDLSAPPMRVPLYATWLATAAALLRVRDGRDRGVHEGWQVLRSGLITCVALTGLQVVTGVLFLFDEMRSQSLEVLPTHEREQLVLNEIGPMMRYHTLLEWGVLIVLLALVVVLARRALRFGTSSRRDTVRTVGSTVLIVAVTVLPVWILTRSVDVVARQWLPMQIAAMRPVALEPDAPLSFYLDRRPQSLFAGRKSFYAEVVGESRTTYTDDALIAGMAASADPELDCHQALAASLDKAVRAPARCISGIEAQLYCEGRGMRLPTPDEWTAALGLVAPGPAASDGVERAELGEWTMHTVHGTETFVVVGRERDEEIPDLRADRASPLVGFRCAFTFD